MELFKPLRGDATTGPIALMISARCLRLPLAMSVEWAQERDTVAPALAAGWWKQAEDASKAVRSRERRENEAGEVLLGLEVRADAMMVSRVSVGQLNRKSEPP